MQETDKGDRGYISVDQMEDIYRIYKVHKLFYLFYLQSKLKIPHFDQQNEIDLISMLLWTIYLYFFPFTCPAISSVNSFFLSLAPT